VKTYRMGRVLYVRPPSKSRKCADFVDSLFLLVTVLAKGGLLSTHVQA